MTEHKAHVRKTLKLLGANDLYLKPEKCEFYRTKVEYLGFVISEEGISMDPKKVAAVKKWEQCTNLHDVRSFLGFANFYRHFIKEYSSLATSLVNLTWKNIPFV